MDLGPGEAARINVTVWEEPEWRPEQRLKFTLEARHHRFNVSPGFEHLIILLPVFSCTGEEGQAERRRRRRRLGGNGAGKKQNIRHRFLLTTVLFPCFFCTNEEIPSPPRFHIRASQFQSFARLTSVLTPYDSLSPPVTPSGVVAVHVDRTSPAATAKVEKGGCGQGEDGGCDERCEGILCHKYIRAHTAVQSKIGAEKVNNLKCVGNSLE